MRATFDILRGRAVTGRTNAEYFRNFQKRAQQRLERWAASNGHTMGVFGGNLKECPPEVSQAILLLNQYPGIENLNPNPALGEHGEQSAFMHRIADGRKEFLKVSDSEIKELSSPVLIGQTRERLLAGETSFDHMVGGNATRMKLGTAKFLLTPAELFNHYKTNIAPTDPSLPLATECQIPALDWPLGVRHMLAFSYAIYRMANEAGQNWHEALAKQTVFLVANEAIMPEILNLFKEWGYFGLDKDNVFFMESSDFNVLTITDGQLTVDPTARTIHNHGVARIQTTMEDTWFRINDQGGRDYQSAATMRRIAEAHESHDSLNIEDVGYLTSAIDIYSEMLSLGLALPDEMAKFCMMMKIVGQKTAPQTPQKGGMLALDPHFYGPGQGRVGVFEAFQLFPVFHHHNKAIAPSLHAKILWLNDNKNSYDPRVLFDVLETTGLPISFEVKEGGFRNEVPQGDLNLFLRTLYVANLLKVNGFERTVPISNLKDGKDIPGGLAAMIRQEAMNGFVAFAKQFHA